MDNETNSPVLERKNNITVLQETTFTPSHEKGKVIKGKNPTARLSKEGLAWIYGAVNNLIEGQQKGFLEAKKSSDEEYVDIELLPLENLPPVLGHITDPQSYKSNEGREVFGDDDTETFTFLQTTDFDVEAYLENDFALSLGGASKRFYRLYIDTVRLQELRDVYLDSESIDGSPEEFGKSFVVKGGIPQEAIVRVELIEMSPRPYEEFDSDFDELDSEETEAKKVAENRAKLNNFMDSL